MLGIGLPEFLVVLGVAVVAIGPKDLPHALHGAGKMFRKFRKITADIQKSIDEVMREEELNDIIREANKPGGENLQKAIEQQLQAEEAEKEKDAAA